MKINDYQDPLIFYFNQELNYLRKTGIDFAKKYPKIASRLQIYPGMSSDPHIERMIESFAFLTARVQYNIDSEFSQIPTAFLEILYPNLMNIIPAMSIAAFEIDPKQGKLTDGFPINRNSTLFASSKNGKTCNFCTCYPLTLWPVTVEEAQFESNYTYDFLDQYQNVAAVMRLRLKTLSDPLHELQCNSLRFYLQGSPMITTALYELLFTNVQQILILPESSKKPIQLPLDSIKGVGFSQDEAMIPQPEYAYSAYRIIQEYFTFPYKFFFFDLDNISFQDSFEFCDVLFLLKETPSKFLSINSENFMLNCAPIINLFKKTTDPLILTHKQSEYDLIPDIYNLDTVEIYSVQRVSSIAETENSTKVYQPYFSFSHEMEELGQEAFWYTHKTISNRPSAPGTLTRISFVDAAFDPNIPESETIYANTICTNRMLADEIPSGTLLNIEYSAPVQKIYCLIKPSLPLYPQMNRSNMWKLISQLSLSYLSLSGDKSSLNALREILRLYAIVNSSSVNQQITGIVDMDTRKIIRRVGRDAWRGFCRGTEITMTFDEENFIGSSSFLFAQVLNHFLGLYTSLNSFTELVIKSKQREGIWKKWKPRGGEKEIL